MGVGHETPHQGGIGSRGRSIKGSESLASKWVKDSDPLIGPLDRLAERGVRLIVCGQTMVGRNLPCDGFLPFVLVSHATTVAHARLAAE